MPWYANKRIKFGEGHIDRNGAVPLIEGRNYAKLERLGIIRWEKEALEASTASPKPPVIEPPTVDIPDGWRDLPWVPKVKGTPSLRTLAANFSDKAIANKDDAVAKIEAEVARREAEKGKTSDDEPKVVNIPDDWRDLPEDKRKELALNFAGDTEVTSIDEADFLIELELEKRQGSGA